MSHKSVSDRYLLGTFGVWNPEYHKNRPVNKAKASLSKTLCLIKYEFDILNASYQLPTAIIQQMCIKNVRRSTCYTKLGDAVITPKTCKQWVH